MRVFVTQLALLRGGLGYEAVRSQTLRCQARARHSHSTWLLLEGSVVLSVESESWGRG